jgi:hypothetical protein
VLQDDLGGLGTVHAGAEVDVHEDEVDFVMIFEYLDGLFCAGRRNHVISEFLEGKLLAVGQDFQLYLGIGLEVLDCLLARVDGQDLVAVFLQEHLLGHRYEHLVLDEQDRFLVHSAHFATFSFSHKDCPPRTRHAQHESSIAIIASNDIPAVCPALVTGRPFLVSSGQSPP